MIIDWSPAWLPYLTHLSRADVVGAAGCILAERGATRRSLEVMHAAVMRRATGSAHDGARHLSYLRRGDVARAEALSAQLEVWIRAQAGPVADDLDTMTRWACALMGQIGGE